MSPRKYDMGRRAEAVEETRRRIVDATYELHAKQGVLATSLQDIADRADVSLRTVYNHFPTLDDLVAGCGSKVLRVLSRPTPEIFDGSTSLDRRIGILVEELFAVYDRGHEMIDVARREQDRVHGLAAFVVADAAMRRDLVEEALRPGAPRAISVDVVTALTDFYVWKALTQQGLSTHQAVDIVQRSLVALAGPERPGRKDRSR